MHAELASELGDAAFAGLGDQLEGAQRAAYRLEVRTRLVSHTATPRTCPQRTASDGTPESAPCRTLAPVIVNHVRVPSYEGTCIPVDDRRRDDRALGRQSVAQRAPLTSPRGAPRPTLSRMTERYWRAAEPKSVLRRRDRGRRRSRPGDRLLPGANHGITDVCVVEKGWLGGGNMARNTTIIRSNYLWDESAAIYEHSLKLWEGLEEELGVRPAVLPAGRDEPGARPGRRPHSSAACTRTR